MVNASTFPLSLRPLRENSLQSNTEAQRQVWLHIIVRQTAASWRNSLKRQLNHI
jgi:hypothetical protein